MTEQEQKIVQNFLDADGKIKTYPAKFAKKLLVLEYLAEKIEPDRTFTEPEINERISAWHTFGDYATLRRDLYEMKFLDREADGSAYRKAQKTE